MTNEIDWTKAPEGATHYAIVDDKAVYYKSNGECMLGNHGRGWITDTSYASWIIDNTHKIPELSTLSGTSAKPLQPVFTKAMQDNGELPSVGMECLIKDDSYDQTYYKSVISFIGRSNTVWTHGGTEYSQSNTHLKFKPITPPIELIDGNWYLVKKDWGSKEERVLHRNNGAWFYDTGEYPDAAEGGYTVISKLLIERGE